MRKFINIFIFIILTCFLASICFAQQGIITIGNKVAVAIKTETIPAGSSENSYGNIYSSSTKDVIHRIMTDSRNKIYFGYDLLIEPQEDSGKFKVSIKPLSKAPDMLVKGGTVAAGSNETAETLGSNTSSVSVGSGGSRNIKIAKTPNYKDYTAQSLPNYPENIIVDAGDTITLVLLENPATNTKIADKITVMSLADKGGFTYSSGSSVRSFSIEDVYMQMETPDIFINGKKYQTNSSVAGKVNWIYVKDKGRFIFSFQVQPRYNFQKIGVIQDNKISFEFNGDKYEIVSKSPILGQNGKWNLWVMHDPAYQPTNQISADSPFIFGAAGKVDFLFERK